VWLAARYNRPGFEIFYYNIYAVCGDGCMMEGTGSEAASLAGHLGLDNLCWVYDNNHITIEGNTRIAFTEDVATRFEPDRVIAAAKDLLSRTKGNPQVPNPAASELASANPLAPPRRHDGSDGRFPPPKLFLVNYLRATSPLPCLAQRLLLN
jgi:hypothetical protein